MGLIESNKVVVVQVVFSVPPGIPTEEIAAWAMNQLTINALAAQQLQQVQAQLRVLEPPPPRITT